jgi:hypothetical protein
MNEIEPFERVLRISLCTSQHKKVQKEGASYEPGNYTLNLLVL